MDNPLKTRILGLIQDRELAPGDKIGSERGLAEFFGATRWEVRKALADLQRENAIIQTFGRSGGVFVATPRRFRDADKLVGVPAFLRSQGAKTGTTVLESSLLPSDDFVASKLELPPEDWIIKVRRARFVDGLPFNYETNIFPANEFPDLLNQDLSGSIYELLEERYSLSRGVADEEITARGAEDVEAEFLQVPEKSPIISIERTSRTTGGTIFEFSSEIYRADRFSIRISTGRSADVPTTHQPGSEVIYVENP